MKLRKINPLIIFLAILLIAGNLLAVSHSESFNVNDLEFSKEERGYDKVKLADLQVTTERGEPELPVKLVNLIIPCGTEVDNIDIKVNQHTLEGTYFINPSPGPVPINEIPEPAEPDSSIYNSPNIFPKNCVKVVSHGYFNGANRIVSLLFSRYSIFQRIVFLNLMTILILP